MPLCEWQENTVEKQGREGGRNKKGHRETERNPTCTVLNLFVVIWHFCYIPIAG